MAGAGAPSSNWPFLLAIASASAGVGFAAFVYVVPYRRMATELRRRSGDAMHAHAAATQNAKELERIKKDLFEIRGASNLSLGEVGRRRMELKVLKAEIEERLKDALPTITIDERRMTVRFPEAAIFDGRSAYLGHQGQETLRVLGEIVAGRTRRLLVAAPVGGSARWLRDDPEAPVDVSLARVRAVVKHLGRVGVAGGTMLAVVAGGNTPVELARTSLDIEIEPADYVPVQ